MSKWELGLQSDSYRSRSIRVLWGAGAILLSCITGVEMKICHIPIFSSVLLSITGTSHYLCAAQQSWQCVLTAWASFVFYCGYFSRSRCSRVSREPFHILVCVSVRKFELIKSTSFPTCVPVYCTFLFALTEAGGVCSLPRIKQMLLCPSCWKWNGLCRLVPAVSL